MNTPSKSAWTTLKAGLLSCSVLCIAAPASADVITLKAIDGTVSVTGELIEFTNDQYVIQSEFGALRVEASLVDCDRESGG